MALTEGAATDFSNLATQIVVVPINDNIGAVVYNDVDTDRTAGRVLDISSGTLSVGAAQALNGTARGSGDIHSPEDDKFILAQVDLSDSDLKLKVISRSGTTLTPGTEYAVDAGSSTNGDFIRVACSNSTVGMVADHKISGAHRLCRFTITGTTLLVGTPQDHTEANVGTPMSLEMIDTNRLLYFYENNSGVAKFQVINISTGISEGTPSTLSGVALKPGGANSGRKMIAKLQADKFLAVYINDQATDRLEAVVINTSGDTISSIGTPLQILANNSAAVPTVWVVSSTKVIIAYTGASGATIVQTLNISGSTITDGGDAITLTQNNATIMGIAVLIDTKAVVARDDADNGHGYVSMISGVPASGEFAKFYQGLGVLTERFTLPFEAVQPQAMTLDKSLGTIVMGANAPAAQPVIYSVNPYVTGTSTSQGFPTGTSISALKWI